jgi:hypothetical protein
MRFGATTTASSARRPNGYWAARGWRFATRDEELAVPVNQKFLLSWFRVLQSAKNGHTHWNLDSSPAVWYMHLYGRSCGRNADEHKTLGVFFIIKHWVLVLQKRRKERKILSRGRSGFRAAWAPWSWIQTLHRKAIANWPSHGSVALDSAAASVGARTEAGAHMNHGRCHAVRRYDDG